MNDIEKEIMTNHKNIKTESMNKFNLIKKKFNSGTLLNSIKKTEDKTYNREPNEIETNKNASIDIKQIESDISVSENEFVSDVRQINSDNDDIIDQSNE
jgi:hypothetical protein